MLHFFPSTFLAASASLVDLLEVNKTYLPCFSEGSARCIVYDLWSNLGFGVAVNLDADLALLSGCMALIAGFPVFALCETDIFS
jgi:hypothetical protein